MSESDENTDPQIDEELSDEQLENVSGGLSLTWPSPPGGPVPIPYPNTTSDSTKK